MRPNKKRIFASALVAIAALALFVAQGAQAADGGYCASRSSFPYRAGEWRWEIFGRFGELQGLLHPCDIDQRVRLAAVERCEELRGNLQQNGAVYLALPTGTSASLVKLACQTWAQAFRFKVYFREAADMPFSELLL